MLYTLILGGIIGAIVWGFISLVNVCVGFLWYDFPKQFGNFPFYTLIICLIGGLVIGIWHKYAGNYPEEMKAVFQKIKKDGKYHYQNISKMTISAFLPLVFGGSVGPESGLVGIIAALCCWLSDKLKLLFNKLKDFTEISISAALGAIFGSPLFGFTEPIENENGKTVIPKSSRIILCFLAIFGALGAAILLKNFFGGSSGLPSLTDYSVAQKEWLFLIPLCLIGVIGGIIYNLSKRFCDFLAKPLREKPILSALCSGLILGIIGTLLPLTMFSGEEQITEIANSYQAIGAVTLILSGTIKLFVTNSCISLGFRGGHFFPTIFSGVAIGFGIGIIFGINSTFAAAVITTALLSYIMKKPFAVILLLMICFPISALPAMILAVVFGNFRLPKNTKNSQ